MLIALALHVAVGSIVSVNTIVTIDTKSILLNPGDSKDCIYQWLIVDPACANSEVSLEGPPVGGCSTCIDVRIKGELGPECAIYQAIWPLDTNSLETLCDFNSLLEDWLWGDYIHSSGIEFTHVDV